MSLLRPRTASASLVRSSPRPGLAGPEGTLCPSILCPRLLLVTQGLSPRLCSCHLAQGRLAVPGAPLVAWEHRVPEGAGPIGLVSFVLTRTPEKELGRQQHKTALRSGQKDVAPMFTKVLGSQGAGVRRGAGSRGKEERPSSGHLWLQQCPLRPAGLTGKAACSAHSGSEHRGGPGRQEKAALGAADGRLGEPGEPLC